MLRVSATIFFALAIGCAGVLPNPTPPNVEAVFAGRTVESLREISSVEQEFFLSTMRWCSWKRTPVVRPGPEFIYEIREADRRSVLVLANGSKLFVGQAYCQLPAVTASKLQELAGRSRR